MIIYPAIDLRAGKCVRLYKGDFAATTVYSDSPADMLNSFAQAGSSWVHLVDLDGAKTGKFSQGELIRELLQNVPLQVEVGGGIRTREELEELFKVGVTRVIVGSICVSQPSLVRGWIAEFGADKIVLALDCSMDKDGVPRVRTHGWQELSSQTVWDVLEQYPQVEYVLCTDVAVDGTLSGPSIALYRQIQLRYPKLNLIASGGVGKLSDVIELKELGVHGVVIGKALYENKFTLEDALAC